MSDPPAGIIVTIEIDGAELEGEPEAAERPDEPNEATEAAVAIVGAVATVVGAVIKEVVEVLTPDDSPSSEETDE